VFLKKMYHCTRKENLEGIMKKGLLPCKPIRISDAVEGVYLSKYPFDWMHYVTEETSVAGAMITVDVDGLDIEKDKGINTGDLDAHPAFVSREKIPPSRFVRVVVSSDDNPSAFEEYKRGEKICLEKQL